MENVSELGGLFLSTTEMHIDTGKFLSRFADVLSTDEARNTCNFFDVFVCERIGMFLNVKSHETFDHEHILPWLFDKCGANGWEIVRTEGGRWLRDGGDGRVHWTYSLYVETR